MPSCILKSTVWFSELTTWFHEITPLIDETTLIIWKWVLRFVSLRIKTNKYLSNPFKLWQNISNKR